MKKSIIILLLILIVPTLSSCKKNNTVQRQPALNNLKSALALTCETNADCRKHNACTEMLCANKDKGNEKIASELSADCEYDLTLYDPPGSFADCGCINNECRFTASNQAIKKCGPATAGANYNTENCNTACDTADDCKYTCGCFVWRYFCCSSFCF